MIIISKNNEEPQHGLDGKAIHLSDFEFSFSKEGRNLKNKEVEIRENCALEDVKKMLKEGESIAEYKFGVIVKDTSNRYKDCPILELKSNHAEYLFLYDSFVIDDSKIKHNERNLGNYVVPKLMLKNAVVLFFVKEFAKGLAKTVGKELFAEFFPRDKDASLNKAMGDLKDEIRKIFQEAKYEGFADELIALRGWLRDTYSKKTESHYKGESINKEEIRDDLRKRQENLKAIIDVITARVKLEDMNNCVYLERVKVLLYAASSALRIILMKEQVFWQKILLDAGNQQYNNNADFNELKEFMQTAADNLRIWIPLLKNGRINKIGPIEEKTDWTGFGENVYETYLLEWRDHFESKDKDDPFRGDKIVWKKRYNKAGKDENRAEIMTQAEKDRNDHINKVKNLFEEHISQPLGEVLKELEKSQALIKL